jgi:hypothetical protein
MDELLTPPEPNQADREAVRLEDWRPEQGSQLFATKILYNYRALLRMDKSVSIRALQVEVVRGPAGDVATTMWARRARNSIVVDWSNGAVLNGNVDSSRKAGGPAPEYIPYGMGIWGGGGSGSLKVKVSDQRHFELLWKPKTMVLPLALDPASRLAFGLETDQSGRTPLGVVVVDIGKKELLGTIPLPKDTEGHACIFQPNDYLMVFDLGRWIMLIDLTKPAVPGVDRPQAKPEP